MNFLIPIVLVCLMAATPASSQGASQAAHRAMEAYRRGNYEMARLFFNRALEEALLRAHEEHMVKAVLNLTDMDLESLDAEGALDRLDALPRVEDDWLVQLIRWKRAQCLFRLGQAEKALAILDSLRSDEEEWQLLWHQDALRFRLDIRDFDSTAWSTELEKLRARLPRSRRASLEGLRALYHMRQGDHRRAMESWEAATDHYRAGHQLARLADALKHLAVCHLALGQRERAVEQIEKARNIYHRLGLRLPSLKVQALQLLVYSDPVKIERIRKELELVGQSVNGFDIEMVLSEYRQAVSTLGFRD